MQRAWRIMNRFYFYFKADLKLETLLIFRVQPPTAFTFLEDPSQGHCPALIVTEGSQVHLPTPTRVALPGGTPQSRHAVTKDATPLTTHLCDRSADSQIPPLTNPYVSESLCSHRAPQCV